MRTSRAGPGGTIAPAGPRPRSCSTRGPRRWGFPPSARGARPFAGTSRRALRHGEASAPSAGVVSILEGMADQRIGGEVPSAAGRHGPRLAVALAVDAALLAA